MSNTTPDLVKEAALFKALGHPSRLMMLRALGDGELCVCELQQLVGADISTVSKHLTILRQVGAVDSRKHGLNVYYRLRLPCFSQFLNCALTACSPSPSDPQSCRCTEAKTPPASVD